MRLIQFEKDKFRGFGFVQDDSTILTGERLRKIYSFNQIVQLIKEHPNLEASCDQRFDMSAVTVLPPVIPTKNIMCIGKNYAKHIREFDGSDDDIQRVKEDPIFFTKALSALNAHKGHIKCHNEWTKQLDYEAELAVVIGRTCTHVTAEEAKEYIFGYTLLNDVTARDIQKRHQQWFRGKSLDTCCPIGPYIVDAESFGDPQGHSIQLRVNGELRQDGNTADMIHTVYEQIATLSQGMTLHCGDVIATGTPDGVGMGMKPPRFLRKGDVVEISMPAIGILTNSIV